jgi:hypothetical protein
MEEQPVPGPAPYPDPTSGNSYDSSMERPIEAPAVEPVKSEEMKIRKRRAVNRRPQWEFMIPPEAAPGIGSVAWGAGASAWHLRQVGLASRPTQT